MQIYAGKEMEKRSHIFFRGFCLPASAFVCSVPSQEYFFQAFGRIFDVSNSELAETWKDYNSTVHSFIRFTKLCHVKPITGNSPDSNIFIDLTKEIMHVVEGD